MTPVADPRREDASPGRARGRVGKVALPLAVGAIVALLPVPSGLTPNAWSYVALFAAVVVALVTEPIPAAAVGFVGVTVAASIRLVGSTPDEAIRWALSGFSNTTVWLIYAAFIFARGYERSGLGRRIALHLVERLGGRTLGLGYAIAFADLALAPFTPSNTARSAGMIYPIVRHIPELYDSHPGESARRIGAYLMWTAFAATAVTSMMFATALAPNLLALQIVRQTAHLDLSLGAWILGVWPVGVLLLAVLPAIVYAIYPPGITRSTEIPVWAAGELAGMGRITRQELVMAGLVLLSVGLWIGGREIVDATTVAFAAVSLMLLTGIVTWDDVVGHSAAWNVWAMIALLVTLADGLARVGFIGWVAHAAADRLAGYPPVVVAMGLVAVFYFVHYLFASLTAHTTAVLPVVLAAGLTVPGMPVRTFALLLCYSIGLMGVLTPYATGPAPVYYGSGFVTRREFWTLGLVCGVIFVVVLLAVGYPYLQATAS